MTERRREQRLKSVLGGKISFGARQSTMDCMVRSVAPHGALVVFPHTSLTPSEFTLHIPCKGEAHSAKVMWRRDDRAGVALSNKERVAHPGVELSEIPIDTARRVRELVRENRRLKRRLDPGLW
jgi:hypothetical protein